MRNFSHFFIMIMVLLFAGHLNAQTLALMNNRDYALNMLSLNDSDLLWLAKKQTLVIGLYEPFQAPLIISNDSGQLKGISADYLALLRNTLNIKISLQKFASEQAALDALDDEVIDMVLTDFKKKSFEDKQFIYSSPLLYTYPSLVVSQDNNMLPSDSLLPVNVAIANDYPDHGFLMSHYPNATIHRFSDVEKALSSVERENNDIFVGNNLEAGYYLTTDYYSTLHLTRTWSENGRNVSFAFNKNNIRLSRMIDLFINAISTDTHNQIIASWIDSGNLSLFDGPLDLTREERQWINKNKQLRVIINPYQFPFSMLDEQKGSRGITGEILDYIHIKTGLTFLPVIAYSNADLMKIINSGGWDLHPAATYSPEREEQVLFTHPYLSTIFVIVVKGEKTSPPDFSKLKSIAVPAHHALSVFLQEKMKGVRIINTENSSMAITLLDEGKVDAAVSTKLSARYFIEHYQTENIKFYPLENAPVAEIAFALPSHSYMLRKILNKAIDNIPDLQMMRVSNKWVSMPNIQADTWDLYKEEFYEVVISAMLLIISSLIWGGYLLREIRKRKASEMDLKDQLKFSSTLSSSVPYPLYVVSQQGELKNHNAAFTAFFADNTKSERGTFISDSSHPLYNVFKKFSASQAADAITENVITYRTHICNGTEDREVIHWFTSFKKSSENTPLLICGWSDITEHSMLMEALKRESGNALAAKRAKGEFIARMSHELRTPVSAIMGFLELLRIDSDKDFEDNIELAYTTGQHLLALIGDVLDLEKIESGSYELSEEWVAITPFMLSTVAMFEALASQKGLTVTLDSAIPPHHHLWLDPKAVRQVLTNLISNAIKFTQQGTITVTTLLRGGTDERFLFIVSVTDTGPGIADDEQQKLFKFFSQTSTGELKPGTGLGLYICHEIIQLAGGQIYLADSSSRGSTFTAEIPTRLSETIAPCSTSTGDSPLANAHSRLQVLIADDNLTNRLLLTRQLTHLGYDVDEVENGQQALDAVSQKHYDLLITDINMPVLDGLELTRLIRKDNNHLVIWGLTANARTEERARCLDAGMQMLLFKPVKLNELADLLASVSTDPNLHELSLMIDTQALTALSLGDSALMRKMLKYGRDEWLKDVQELLHAQKSSNPDEFADYVHRIAGTAQILGAVTVSNLCESIELQLHLGTKNDIIATATERLAEELRRLIRAIDEFLVCTPDAESLTEGI